MSQPDELMELIQRAKAGDGRAVDALMVEVRQRVKGFFHRRAGPIESSDLAQDASFTVVRSLRQFAGKSEQEFWGWAMAVARTTQVDDIRYRTRKKRAGNEVPLPEGSSGGIRLAAADETPSQIVSQREQESNVQAALQRLTNEEQQVIRLRYFAERDWVEIAEALNKTEAAAKKFYQRTIKKWRQECEAN